MKPIAILHEGNAKKTHDNDLISLLIQHLKLDISLIDFYGMGRKSHFFKTGRIEYQLLKSKIINNQTQKVLFIVDADYEETDQIYGGFENTTLQLKTVIKTLEIENISRHYIMCDPDTKTGYLESFILSTIPEQQALCIKKFLECSQFKSKENHKAIVHQIYNMAYPKAPYNFEHPHFDYLKTQLINLFDLE